MQGRRFNVLGLKALLAGSSSPVVETTQKYPLRSQRPWGWYQPWLRTTIEVRSLPSIPRASRASSTPLSPPALTSSSPLREETP